MHSSHESFPATTCYNLLVMLLSHWSTSHPAVSRALINPSKKVLKPISEPVTAPFSLQLQYSTNFCKNQAGDCVTSPSYHPRLHDVCVHRFSVHRFGLIARSAGRSFCFARSCYNLRACLAAEFSLLPLCPPFMLASASIWTYQSGLSS